jgi:hypothetical protein
MKASSNVKHIFGQIEDHRSHINRLHNLVDILSYQNNFAYLRSRNLEQMVVFAKSKETFSKKFLELSNCIPSKVILNKVFSEIDSE